MSTTMRVARAALFGAFALLGASANSVSAQTPEGTVIENIATVSFTDANGNSYANVADSVSITVAFQGSVDVVAPANQFPGDGSTDNALVFTINNLGNGVDTVAVDSIPNSNPSITTNVRYVVGTDTVTTLSALNTLLGSNPIASGGSLNVTVLYDLVPGSGGGSTDISLFGTSTRDGATDSDVVTVAPPLGGDITVVAVADTVQRLPGGPYTATFDVTNSLSGADSVDLAALAANANVTITEINGVSGGSLRLYFAASETKSITITYTVADVAAGSEATITLTGTAATTGDSGDDATLVQVVRPAMTITKGAYSDAAVTTPVTSVVPGETVYYLLTVQNSGTAGASTVELQDVLPAQVTFVSVNASGSPTTWDAGPTYSAGTRTVSGTVNTLSVGASASYIIEVTIN